MIPDGRVADTGKIILADKPRKLVLTWENQFLPELTAERHSTLTYEFEQIPSSVKFTLTHEIARTDSKLIDAVSQGWPSLMSSLTSLLETGHPLAETTKCPEDM